MLMGNVRDSLGQLDPASADANHHRLTAKNTTVAKFGSTFRSDPVISSYIGPLVRLVVAHRSNGYVDLERERVRQRTDLTSLRSSS